MRVLTWLRYNFSKEKSLSHRFTFVIPTEKPFLLRRGISSFRASDSAMRNLFRLYALYHFDFLQLSSRGKRSDKRSLCTSLPVDHFTVTSSPVSTISQSASSQSSVYSLQSPLYFYIITLLHHSRHLSLRVIFDRKLYREVLLNYGINRCLYNTYVLCHSVQAIARYGICLDLKCVSLSKL